MPGVPHVEQVVRLGRGFVPAAHLHVEGELAGQHAQQLPVQVTLGRVALGLLEVLVRLDEIEVHPLERRQVLVVHRGGVLEVVNERDVERLGDKLTAGCVVAQEPAGHPLVAQRAGHHLVVAHLPAHLDGPVQPRQRRRELARPPVVRAAPADGQRQLPARANDLKHRKRLVHELGAAAVVADREVRLVHPHQRLDHVEVATRGAEQDYRLLPGRDRVLVVVGGLALGGPLGEQLDAGVGVEQPGVRHGASVLERRLPVRPEGRGSVARRNRELQGRRAVAGHLGVLGQPRERPRRHRHRPQPVEDLPVQRTEPAGGDAGQHRLAHDLVPEPVRRCLEVQHAGRHALVDRLGRHVGQRVHKSGLDPGADDRGGLEGSLRQR